MARERVQFPLISTTQTRCEATSHLVFCCYIVATGTIGSKNESKTVLPILFIHLPY